MKPLGAPLAPQNHSVTDQGYETVVWGGWEDGSGWANKSSFCLPLLTWNFEQVGV